jgi:hypothetical protein
MAQQSRTHRQLRSHVLYNSFPCFAESEYGIACKTARQIIWLRQKAAALGHTQPTSTTHVDNTTAVGLANDTLMIARSKTIDNWLRDRVPEANDKICSCSKRFTIKQKH